MSQPAPPARPDPLTETIRRTIRVLGAQPLHASRPVDVQAAAMLIHGRLTRSGIPTQWIEGEHGTPLVIAGEGPVAITTYLDDNHPDASGSGSDLPEIRDSVVHGRAISRKIAIVAHLTAFLADPSLATRARLFIETDRQSGSHTLEQWLERERPALVSAAWEVGDLPLNPPLVVRASTGVLIVEIKLIAARKRAEPVYGTVLPDLGIALSAVLTSLKSPDDEVLIPGFYDGIVSPDSAEVDTLIKIGPGVSRWLTSVAGRERELSTSHMTLGMFCAPSLVVRGIEMRNPEDYLPETASAVVELQLLPGQTPERILESLTDHVHALPFETVITPLLVRSPVDTADSLSIPEEFSSISIAPGLSPASIFRDLGIPSVGYGLVGRVPEESTTGMPIESIANRSEFLVNLVQHLSRIGLE